jgi:ATP-dependent DNA helicase RecG
MVIEVSQITALQADKILNQEESHFVDLKSLDISPAKLTKTISAFANASGGEIYIGIDEKNTAEGKKRSWRGFDDQEAANGHIQVFESIFPLGQYYSYSFLRCPVGPGLVLVVEINKSRNISKASDGTIYIRRGAMSLPVSGEESIERLRLDKGIQSFETETVDIELDFITNSSPIIEFLIEVVPTADPEPWLKKQQLIKFGKPTVAGVLLFAEEPQSILPKRCGVKIYRYKTSDLEGTRDTLAFNPITIDGCLYDQIKTTVAKTVEVIEDIQKLGTKGFEIISYPFEALHEILTNALLHRDYSIPVDVHVRIFDNRIEIESPGKLPGHITQDNILSEQFARNAHIVRLINKFPDPPNNDVGEGLNTAFQAMTKLRLKLPEIIETISAVLVIIKHETLASPEESVMTLPTKVSSVNLG